MRKLNKSYYKNEYGMLLNGEAFTILKTLPSKSVQTCITSPPYWGLRDYGVDGQLGLESTPGEYVERVVKIFRQVRRVLRDDGTLWLNLGDSYAGGGGVNGIPKNWDSISVRNRSKHPDSNDPKKDAKALGLKSKDLVGIPWKVAFALQSDGWYLRQDIIWCLSGGTWLYVRTPKNDGPMMLRDIARLRPETIHLWNGLKWTQVLGISKTPRTGTEIEIILRSGERISCTPMHKFPTDKGLLKASEIRVGDCLKSTYVPEPKHPKRPKHITNDAAWFAGTYLADGNISSKKCIRIYSSPEKDKYRWPKLHKITEEYGGSITKTIYRNKTEIRIYSKLLNSLLNELISGKTAKDKCLSSVCWNYDNNFLQHILYGYLHGDGSWDKTNKRWRIRFTRNYNLERDLRTLSARLGFNLTLKLSNSFIKNKKFPSFRGEIKFERTVEGHWNQKNKMEVIEIRKARARFFYDIGVADEPHVYSLASGVLTHNSKKDPMPESVTDRCTKAHEYIFLLSKNKKYYFDHEAIMENSVRAKRSQSYTENNIGIEGTMRNDVGNTFTTRSKRNKRSVWTVPTENFPDAHFAVFPEALIIPCILAGAPGDSIVLDPFCGSGTTAAVSTKLNRKWIGIELSNEYCKIAVKRLKKVIGKKRISFSEKKKHKIKKQKKLGLVKT